MQSQRETDEARTRHRRVPWLRDFINFEPQRELFRRSEGCPRCRREAGDSDARDQDAALTQIADALDANTERIVEANGHDIERATANGTSAALIDRLTLTLSASRP